MKVIVLALLVLVSFAYVAQGKKLSNQILWDRYRAALLDFFAKGSRHHVKNIQLVPGRIDADWDVYPNNLQRIASTPYKNKATWELQVSGMTFQKSYSEFLNSLKVSQTTPNPMAERQLDNLEMQLQNIMWTVLEEEMACRMKMDQSRGAAKNEAEFQSYARSSCYDYMALTEEQDYILGQIQFVSRRVHGTFKMWKAMNAIAKFAIAKNNLIFREYNSLESWMKNNQRGKKSPMSFEITHSSTDSSSSSSWKKTGFALPFISYNSAKQDAKLSTADEAFKIKFSAESYAALRIYPDPSWFNGDTVHDWKRGPFTKHDYNYFFGNNGKLKMVPRTLYVAYKPSITMTLNQEDKTKMESMKSSGFSISFGGIGFGLNKSKSKVEVKEKDGLFEYQIIGRDETPQLLAVSFIET